MLDAGMLLIVTATDLTQSDYKILKTVVEREFEIVWVGNDITTDISLDLQLADKDYEKSISKIKNMLKDAGMIFRA